MAITMTLEGHAIPLKPGERYIILINEDVMAKEAIEYLKAWCQYEQIGACLLYVNGAGMRSALRVLSVEAPDAVKIEHKGTQTPLSGE